MDTIVKLDGPHFKAATDRARALGQTMTQYVHSLIDTDTRSFDEILNPIRAGFDSVSDDELDAMFDRAKKDARSQDRAAG